MSNNCLGEQTSNYFLRNLKAIFALLHKFLTYLKSAPLKILVYPKQHSTALDAH